MQAPVAGRVVWPPIQQLRLQRKVVRGAGAAQPAAERQGVGSGVDVGGAAAVVGRRGGVEVSGDRVRAAPYSVRQS